jgi:hypothetical protein
MAGADAFSSNLANWTQFPMPYDVDSVTLETPGEDFNKRTHRNVKRAFPSSGILFAAGLGTQFAQNFIERMETLPWRSEPRLAKKLNATGGELKLRFETAGVLPTLLCALPRPASQRINLVLRVHSRAGIPLAIATAELTPGASTFESTPVAVLAMEGFAHVSPMVRQRIEARVWSRRAYAVASAT